MVSLAPHLSIHCVTFFRTKTYRMIETCDPEICSWTPDGEMFVVKNPVGVFSSLLREGGCNTPHNALTPGAQPVTPPHRGSVPLKTGKIRLRDHPPVLRPQQVQFVCASIELLRLPQNPDEAHPQRRLRQEHGKTRHVLQWGKWFIKLVVPS